MKRRNFLGLMAASVAALFVRPSKKQAAFSVRDIHATQACVAFDGVGGVVMGYANGIFYQAFNCGGKWVTYYVGADRIARTTQQSPDALGWE